MPEASLHYFFEETNEFKLNPATVKWLENSLLGLFSASTEINYIFCSDDYLLKVNQEYLNHDYYTDIITFNNSDEDSDEIESDIFISVDRVKDNSKEGQVPYEQELCRVLIHGILHLAGYNDKTDEEQEEMTRMEDKYLALHPEIDL